jgi:predicted  nucleic acid-binding Zn-ribbon protein
MNTKDEFVRKMHSELDQWNNKIDTLVTKVDQAEEQVHAELHKKIEALRGKQDKAHNQLSELEQASEKAWEDMKAGVEIAWEDMNLGIETVWDAISEAIDSAKSRFK